MSSERYYSEYKPTWKRIKDPTKLKGIKMLFKETNGPAVIGVWYEGCGWEWYCGLPKHAPEDKLHGETEAKHSGQRDWVLEHS